MRGLANALILVGLASAGYLGYQLLRTNELAAHAADQTVERIEREWQPTLVQPADGVQEGHGREPAASPVPAQRGDAVALLRIPKLADQWRQQPVVEGVDAEQLAAGVGHYPGTALPGKVGNFAIAGHRLGHGQPFHWLDRLEAGDLIELVTANAAYHYRVTGSEVVSPSESVVLAPVPGQSGTTPSEARMTLTTCHPRYSSRQRLVYYAVLDTVGQGAD